MEKLSNLFNKNWRDKIMNKPNFKNVELKFNNENQTLILSGKKNLKNH